MFAFLWVRAFFRGSGTVSGQGGQTFLEKIRRQAPKFFLSLPTGFQFAYPGFNKMVGKRPSCDYLNKSSLKSSLLPPFSLSHSAYAIVCMIISNHTPNILAVTAVHECQEFDIVAILPL